MGTWYRNLAGNRTDPSPEIKQKVAQLTASEPTVLGKMRLLAGFVQNDIRYVAIELGIGGLQPHPAAEVFVHRSGDRASFQRRTMHSAERDLDQIKPVESTISSSLATFSILKASVGNAGGYATAVLEPELQGSLVSIELHQLV
jgi:hypothetical protein